MSVPSSLKTAALEIVENGSYQFYQGMDLTEVAEELVNDCYFTKETPDIFTRYFDYEAFGRDLSFDGYHETEWGVIYID
jgi:antirestriction protein